MCVSAKHNRRKSSTDSALIANASSSETSTLYDATLFIPNRQPTAMHTGDDDGPRVSKDESESKGKESSRAERTAAEEEAQIKLAHLGYQAGHLPLSLTLTNPYKRGYLTVYTCSPCPARLFAEASISSGGFGDSCLDAYTDSGGRRCEDVKRCVSHAVV